MKNCNWSPLGDRIRGLPLRSFPSDGLNVRLRFTRRWRLASHPRENQLPSSEINS